MEGGWLSVEIEVAVIGAKNLVSFKQLAYGGLGLDTSRNSGHKKARQSLPGFRDILG